MGNLKITDALPLPDSAGKIPQLGFGVYKSPTDLATKSCLTALDVGYRHIDTAQMYGNEKEVGEALRQTDIPRGDIFVTTKIIQPAGSVEANYAKCLESVKKIDGGEGGYVDLFLIHSSKRGAENIRQIWLALERLYEEGKAKSIGVSNFGIKHFEAMKECSKVWPPHVNQIEVRFPFLQEGCPSQHLLTDCILQLHPWCQQKEIVEYCEKHGIVIEAYCPIVRNQKADDPTLNAIAKKYGVTPNQVLIRYSLQRNWIPLPKSDSPERIKLNADVYGFELSQEDMDALNGLDQGAAGAISQAVVNS